MPTNLCLVCHFKNTCNKNQSDTSKCNHRKIVNKMLHHLLMSLDEVESQSVEGEEINILDELLAK